MGAIADIRKLNAVIEIAKVEPPDNFRDQGTHVENYDMRAFILSKEVP